MGRLGSTTVPALGVGGRTESALPAPAQPAVRGRRVARAPGSPTSEGAAFGVQSYDARAIDWGLVRTFRQRASQKLAEQLRSRPGVDKEDRRELGRSLVRSLLEDHARADALGGTRLMDLDDEQALATAIFDSLFGLGRLQPFVDLPDIENIEITGCDSVLLLHADGRHEIGPPVADSDEELVEFLAFLAAQRGGGERTFSSANPVLHLDLGGRARLAASWKCRSGQWSASANASCERHPLDDDGARHDRLGARGVPVSGCTRAHVHRGLRRPGFRQDHVHACAR